MQAPVTASITAQNTFTTPFQLVGNSVQNFALHVAGTFVANVTVQAKPAGASDGSYVDMESTYLTKDKGLFLLSAMSGFTIRAGVKTGDYTSGTVDLTLVY